MGDGSAAHSFGHHFGWRSFQNRYSGWLNAAACECQWVSLLAFLFLRLLEQEGWTSSIAHRQAYASKTPLPILYSLLSIEGCLFKTRQAAFGRSQAHSCEFHWW